MNIHPSLLPHFPGLHAQRRALESGARYSGCTVHMVDGGVDTGKIIVQKAVPILRNDTVESLSARILEQEHKAYAQAVKMFMKQRVRNPAVNGFCKPFNDIDGAIQFALKRGMSYMWRNGDHTMISEKPPESVPHVAVTPDDTTDVLQSRLDNMIVLDHASVTPRQPTTTIT